jgi:phosphatidylcholine synthase
MAWATLVHIFTATGAVCSLFATIAVIARSWEAAFAWLGLALLIDGVDGTLARWAKVQQRIPRFSGDRLDLVVDYTTYVFVPALALLLAGFLQGPSGMALASGILLSSLFHFSDTQSKASDHSFIGFPAIWNFVAFYVFAFATSQWTTGILVVACILLTFVPLKWVHPLRTLALRPVTLLVALLGGVAAVSTLLRGFPAGPWEKAVLALAAFYGLALTALAGRAR